MAREERQTLLLRQWKPVTTRMFVRDWTIPAVVLVQLSLLVFAWTFSGFMIHKTIPLPDGNAEWIERNPSDTQVAVTLVSTIFALIGSSLLGKAVQYALVRRLACGPLRLAAMLQWANLSQRTISLDGRLPWILFSVAWIALLGFLTTAWSTLLAPESVVIYYGFKDLEFDFLGPSVSHMIFEGLPPPQPNFTLDPSGVDSYLTMNPYADMVTTLLDAGVAVVESNTPNTRQHATSFIGIPFSSYISNISTGGIGLSTFDPVLVHLPSVGIDGFENGRAWYQGLSRTYNVTQQGFTANVSCRAPIAGDPVITPNITNSFESISGFVDEYSVDTYNWSTNCSSEVQYSTFGVTISKNRSPSNEQVIGANGLLMTSICFGQSFGGPSNQSFLVLLTSPLYSSYASFNLTCQVMPLVTTVQATYDENNIINITHPNVTQHTLPDQPNTNNTILTWFPAIVIWSIFIKSQGLTGNLIGDQIPYVLGSQYANVIATALESYLRGMVEYIGTFMKAEVLLDGTQTLPDLTQINGTVVVQTFGWTFHLRTHGLSLVAITLVTLLTAAAGVFAILQVDPSDDTSETKHPQTSSSLVLAFNPTGAMDLLLASSAGDLSRVLSELGDVYRRKGVSEGYSIQDADAQGGDDRLRVMLGTTGEGWPALRTVGMDNASFDGATRADGDFSGSTL